MSADEAKVTNRSDEYGAISEFFPREFDEDA